MRAPRVDPLQFRWLPFFFFFIFPFSLFLCVCVCVFARGKTRFLTGLQGVQGACLPTRYLPYLQRREQSSRRSRRKTLTWGETTAWTLSSRRARDVARRAAPARSESLAMVAAVLSMEKILCFLLSRFGFFSPPRRPGYLNYPLLSVPDRSTTRGPSKRAPGHSSRQLEAGLPPRCRSQWERARPLLFSSPLTGRLGRKLPGR